MRYGGAVYMNVCHISFSCHVYRMKAPYAWVYVVHDSLCIQPPCAKFITFIRECTIIILTPIKVSVAREHYARTRYIHSRYTAYIVRKGTSNESCRSTQSRTFYSSPVNVYQQSIAFYGANCTKRKCTV